MQITNNRIIKEKLVDLIDEKRVEVVHQLCVKSSPRLFFYFKHQMNKKDTQKFIRSKSEGDFQYYWVHHKLED
jgi:hypothetical protein